MLVDVYPYPHSIDEFVEKWMQEKIVYQPDKLITKVQSNKKVVTYHPVHPKESSNRKYLEDNMKKDLEYLLWKLNGVA